jgi:hypothetical protein
MICSDEQAKYSINKERVRNEAIDWQMDFGNNNYSWGELAGWQDYFSKQAKKYGLVEEFKENGII